MFNLKDDLPQKKNLFSAYPEKVAAMKALLDEYVGGKPCAPHAQP